MGALRTAIALGLSLIVILTCRSNLCAFDIDGSTIEIVDSSSIAEFDGSTVTGGSSATPDFMWRCESATLDGTHDYSAGDTTGTTYSSVAFNSDAAYNGTNGLDCPTSYDRVHFDISAGDLFDGSTGGTFCGWVEIETFGDGASIFYVTDSLGTSGAGCYQSGTSEIECRFWSPSGTNSVTSVAGLSTSTWYWVEYSSDVGGSSHRLRIYSSSDVLIDSVEESDPLVSFSPNVLVVGLVSVSADEHLDLFMIFPETSLNTVGFNDYTSYTSF